jgi:hypothetical protein
MGSANVATINKYDLDNRGFWAVKEEVYACHTELDHLMDNLDSDNNNKWEAFHANI